MNERVLLLLFYLDDKQYAIEAKHVAEVTPPVTLEAVPHAPEGVAGLFHYRGRMIPVIDLCQLVVGRPCRIRMSTRIILIHYTEAQIENAQLGLLAERVTETAHKYSNERLDTGMEIEKAPYLGPIYQDSSGLIRCLRPHRVLTDEIRQGLHTNRER